MNKELLIRLLVLLLMVVALVNAPALLGQVMYQAIMIAIGAWQIGVWSSRLGTYLVEKFCA